MLHKDVGLGEVHSLINWEVADADALAALVVGVKDKGKLAWVTAESKGYILISLAPTVWKAGIGAGGGAGSGGGDSLLGQFIGETEPKIGTMRYYPRTPITITAITAWLSVPAIQPVVAAVRINGIIIQQITILAGQDFKKLVVEIAVLATDYITLDIVSGVGRDLTLRLDY